MTTGFSTAPVSSSLQGASSYELGSQVSEFRSAPKRNIGRNIGMVVIIAGIALVTFMATSPVLSRDDRTGGLIGGAIIAGIGYLLVEGSLRYRQTEVFVFQNGLVRSRDGKTDVIRWDAIQALWQNVTKHYTNGVYTGTTHVYTIQTVDSKRLVFNDSIKQVEQLGNYLQNVITTLRLPEVYSAYQAGHTVNFGPVAISLSGVSKGNQTVAWNDIQGVEVVKGYIKFKKQGAWFNFANVHVAQVPNLFVFLALVDRIVGIKTKGK